MALTIGNIIVDSCISCISVPNAFTPNHDGVNDMFRVYTNCSIQDFSMKVYDRWGHQVFLSNEISHSWDGSYHNETCTTDVYVYEIEYTDKSKQKHELLKGTLMLLK